MNYINSRVWNYYTQVNYRLSEARRLEDKRAFTGAIIQHANCFRLHIWQTLQTNDVPAVFVFSTILFGKLYTIYGHYYYNYIVIELTNINKRTVMRVNTMSDEKIFDANSPKNSQKLIKCVKFASNLHQKSPRVTYM